MDGGWTLDAGASVAYARKGALRAGVVERRDCKAALVVREFPSLESVKVSEKSVEMRFAASADAETAEALASEVAANAQPAARSFHALCAMPDDIPAAFSFGESLVGVFESVQ